MKRPLTGLVLILVFLAAGCKPSTATPETAPKTDDIPVVTNVPTPARPGDNIPKEPEAAVDLDKTAPLDLSPLGIYGTINAPVGTEAKWSYGNVISFTHGKDFDMELKVEPFDLATVKKEAQENQHYKVKQFAVESPDTLVFETDFLFKSSWFFKVNVRLGETTYGFTRLLWASKDEAMRYVRVAKSLRQTDLNKQQAVTVVAAVKALEDAGGKVTFADGKYGVELGRQRATDALNAHIAKLPRLDSLELADSDAVTPAGMAPLGTAIALRKFTLRGESYTDGHLAFLAPLKNLEVLVLGRTAITGPGLAHLAGCTKLKNLDIFGERFDDAGCAQLGKLKSLTHLVLSETSIGDNGVAQLKGLTALQHLNLMKTNVGDAGLKALAEMRSLTYLHLDETKVTGTGLANLSSEAKFEGLSLSKSSVTDAGLASLKNKSVQHLSLRETTVTGAGLVHLKGVLKLKDLDLAVSDVTDAGLAALKDLPSLVELNLDRCAVGDAGMVHVAAMAKLERLNLEDTSVTGAGLEKLKALKLLTDIYLTKTKVTPAEVEAFKKGREKVNVSFRVK